MFVRHSTAGNVYFVIRIEAVEVDMHDACHHKLLVVVADADRYGKASPLEIVFLLNGLMNVIVVPNVLRHIIIWTVSIVPGERISHSPIIMFMQFGRKQTADFYSYLESKVGFYIEVIHDGQCNVVHVEAFQFACPLEIVVTASLFVIEGATNLAVFQSERE